MIFVLQRKYLTILTCTLAAAIMIALVSHPNAIGAAATQRQLPIYAVQMEERKVAISFDAAWGNEDTPLLIDILERYDVPATFFLVGQWVDNYPQSVKALADAGHSVQNHSNTHPKLTELSPDGILEEVNACNDKIEAITGVRPTLIRPPYGDYNDKVVNVIRSLDMEPIQWDVDASHTKGMDSDFVYPVFCHAPFS